MISNPQSREFDDVSKMSQNVNVSINKLAAIMNEKH